MTPNLLEYESLIIFIYDLDLRRQKLLMEFLQEHDFGFKITCYQSITQVR